MDAQVKIIAQQNHQLKELEERERVATENVIFLLLIFYVVTAYV